jgi:hypothetical protein
MDQGNWLDRPTGPRGSGSILLGVGILATYLGLLGPYLSHRSPSYGPVFVLALAGPPMVIVGLSFLLGGESAVALIGDPRKPLKWAYWITLPLVGLGLMLFLWLRPWQVL